MNLFPSHTSEWNWVMQNRRSFSYSSSFFSFLLEWKSGPIYFFSFFIHFHFHSHSQFAFHPFQCFSFIYSIFSLRYYCLAIASDIAAVILLPMWIKTNKENECSMFSKEVASQQQQAAIIARNKQTNETKRNDTNEKFSETKNKNLGRTTTVVYRMCLHMDVYESSQV